jgi:hypothetical protein
MIRIQSHHKPVVYQIDQSWTLPSVSGGVQWNGIQKQFEVSDGARWLRIDNTVVLNTSTDVVELLEWVAKKRQEEQELEQLANSHITLAALIEEQRHLQNKIAMVASLIKEENP